MSEMAKAARAAMKAKAARLTAEGSAKDAGPGDDPSKRIDASGWAEPTMNSNAQTGMRPVSRRQFKSGGAVSGEHTKHRADRKARKSGGKVDAYINRDVRAANHEIAQPHIGGFAHGGGVNFRKQMHGMMGVAENKHGRRNAVGKFERSHKAAGGGNWIAGAIKHPGALHRKLHVPEGEKIPAKKLNKAAHSENPTTAHEANLAKTLKRMHHAKGGKVGDEAQDKKMIASAVHKHERHDHKGEPLTKLRHGGRTHKAGGGKTDDGGRGQYNMSIRAKNLLDDNEVKKLYRPPVYDPQGAEQMLNRMHDKRGGRAHKATGGSMGDINGMRPKGDRIPRKHGGKAKGKTNIIIGIHAGGAHQPPQMPPGAMPKPMAPPPAPPPQMPAGGAPMGGGMPPGGMAGMMPPNLPMPRKAGGKVVGAKYADASIAKAERTKSPKGMDVGAGGGLGRLAKAAIARREGFKPVTSESR